MVGDKLAFGGALVCVAFATGCGSDEPLDHGGGSGGSSSGGSAGSGASGGTTAAGGVAGITGKTVTYSGKLSEITASGTSPLGNVELCSPSHPAVACVTAAADGTYTWPGLPANTEVSLKAT